MKAKSENSLVIPKQIHNGIMFFKSKQSKVLGREASSNHDNYSVIYWLAIPCLGLVVMVMIWSFNEGTLYCLTKHCSAISLTLCGRPETNQAVSGHEAEGNEGLDCRLLVSFSLSCTGDAKNSLPNLSHHHHLLHRVECWVPCGLASRLVVFVQIYLWIYWVWLLHECGCNAYMVANFISSSDSSPEYVCMYVCMYVNSGFLCK